MSRQGELKWRGMTGSDTFNWAVGLVGVLICLLMLIVGVSSGNTAAVGAGAAGLAGVGPLVAWHACRTLRPVVLAETELPVPAGFRTKVMRPDQVAGVGLVYFAFAGPRPPGWYPHVSDRAGERTRLGAMAAAIPLALGSPGGASVAEPAQWLARAKESWEDLNASTAGKMVAKIYGWAVERQGGLGPLATLAFEKVDTSSLQERRRRPRARAWWSPDGTMGRAASGQPGARPSA